MQLGARIAAGRACMARRPHQLGRVGSNAGGECQRCRVDEVQLRAVLRASTLQALPALLPAPAQLVAGAVGALAQVVLGAVVLAEGDDVQRPAARAAAADSARRMRRWLAAGSGAGCLSSGACGWVSSRHTDAGACVVAGCCCTTHPQRHARGCERQHCCVLWMLEGRGVVMRLWRAAGDVPGQRL